MNKVLYPYLYAVTTDKENKFSEYDYITALNCKFNSPKSKGRVLKYLTP